MNVAGGIGELQLGSDTVAFVERTTGRQADTITTHGVCHSYQMLILIIWLVGLCVSLFSDGFRGKCCRRRSWQVLAGVRRDKRAPFPAYNDLSSSIVWLELRNGTQNISPNGMELLYTILIYRLVNWIGVERLHSRYEYCSARLLSNNFEKNSTRKLLYTYECPDWDLFWAYFSYHHTIDELQKNNSWSFLCQKRLPNFNFIAFRPSLMLLLRHGEIMI